MTSRMKTLVRRSTSRRHSPVTQPRFLVFMGGMLLLAACYDAGIADFRPLSAAQVSGSSDDQNAPQPSVNADAETASPATAGPIEPVGSEGHGHHDPVAPVLAAIVLILLLAKVGGDLFERMHLPAVLGELVLGVLLGNAYFLTGSEFFEFMQLPAPGEAPTEITVGESLKILAGIGVVLLLFEVGLESTLRQMFSVGLSSLAVAVVGVAVPMALGYYVCRAFFFDEWQQPIFIGATLCATSVGITARVLKDIGKSKDTESRIILGAAVLDDVLGLIMLAVASGVITAASTSGDAAGVPWEAIGRTIAWAVAFLGGALILGTLAVPKILFHAAGYLRGHGLLLATALMICFGMSYLASLVGLATIVGAFAAGLILEQAQYRDLERREDAELEESLHPLTSLLVPIFFVQTGMGVKLSAMGDPSTWILAATLTLIAIVGKLVCSLVVFEKGLNRLAIGIGMVPRGEVGLIFADQGRRLMTPDGPAINDATFSAIVFMVMVTTLITPPILRWNMTRQGSQSAD